VAKYSAGQAVMVAFNGRAPDLRVPDQVNGRYPGKGEYQTEANEGVILEIRENGNGVFYLVDVHLTIRHGSRLVESWRKRVISEDKLSVK
jgi:hypothetical protein